MRVVDGTGSEFETICAQGISPITRYGVQSSFIVQTPHDVSFFYVPSFLNFRFRITSPCRRTRIILATVDVHTHWARALVVSPKQGQTVFKSLMESSAQQLGAPREIRVDAAGEFFGKFRTLHLGGLGFRPDFRPQWPRALLVGKRKPSCAFKNPAVNKTWISCQLMFVW